MRALLVAIGFFALFYLVLLLFPQIAKRDKIIGAVILLILAVAAVIYETASEDSTQRNMLTIEAFRNGKILDCKNSPVSKENYNYISGTNTFVGKPNSEVNMQRYQVGDCRIKEADSR